MNIDEYRKMREQESKQTDQPVQEVKEKVVDTPVQEEIKEEVKEDVKEEEKREEKQTIPEKFNIEGIGELSLEDIKNGYLRQADYTKKTQEVAKLRKENAEALELYKFLKANPDVAKQMEDAKGGNTQELQKFNPIMQHMEELEQQLYDLKLENQISKLSSKYEDFNVLEVLEMAQSKNMDNLEDAYRLVKAGKPVEHVDMDALRKQIKAEIVAEIEREKKETKTIISTHQGNPPKEDNKPKLSKAELKAARGLGLTAEEYLKYKR